ncbi:MAG: hypothetical protein P8X91_06595 [Candidatus Bathyarchaeota archaeon]
MIKKKVVLALATFLLAFNLISSVTATTSEIKNNYGGEYEDIGYSLIQTTDNGFLIAGSTLSYSPYGADVYLVKVDSVGNLLWNLTYGGTNYDEAFS